MPQPRSREWVVIAGVALFAVIYLPIVVDRTVGHGFGDQQVFFRAAWAVWNDYPLYAIADHHGWTFHYPPTLALLLAPFADPLPGYARPAWAMPYVASVTIWYLLNLACLTLSLHLWAKAVERHAGVVARPGSWQGWWVLRLGPFLAIVPYVAAGLERGQPTPLLLLLIVAFLFCYVEGRVRSASLALGAAIAIKVFPGGLLVLPLMRRDWSFLSWTAGWCALFLVGLPVACVGPAATIDLYRAMWIDQLGGILSGAMSNSIASEISIAAYRTVSIGGTLTRIAAGRADFTMPTPGWASAIQYSFNIAIIAAVIILGRGRFWSLRGPQPATGYPLLVAAAVVCAAMPLIIAVAKPHYVTLALPLLAVLTVEVWRHAGRQILSGWIIGWAVVATLAMATLELPVPAWIKVAGPMTWALLALVAVSLPAVRRTGRSSEGRHPHPAA